MTSLQYNVAFGTFPILFPDVENMSGNLEERVMSVSFIFLLSMSPEVKLSMCIWNCF